MARLHELLAYSGQAKSQADRVRAELSHTFESKRQHFTEKIVSVQLLAEGAEPTVETQSDLQTTVPQELEWIGNHLAKALDVQYQINVANMQAKADVVISDGKTAATLLKDVPTQELLELETRLQEIQQLVAKAPTLDPVKGFTLDPMRGDGIYKAREVIKPKTEKQMKVLIKYEATKEHPAQTESYMKDERIGTIREQEWSGMLTPAIKADMLDRCEILMQAVKRARSRANELEIDVAGLKVGNTIMDYIVNGGK